MAQRQILVFMFGLLAAAAAVVFFAISLDQQVYAPGISVVRTDVSNGGHSPLHRVERALPPIAKRNLTPRRVLRKVYSIIAFGIVGFFAAPLIGKSQRVAGDAFVVAAFSAVIEVAQRFTGPRESLWWNAFDIGCGAIGGWLGALAFNALARMRRLRGDAVS